MSYFEEKKKAPLLTLQVLRIRGYSIFHYFTELGVTQVRQLLSMRVYDYLNLNHIDNNIAEEALICLYRFFYPEREDLDEMIRYNEIDQPIDLQRWKRSINSGNITVGDLLAKEFINEDALSRIFYFISQNFYKSSEYDWHEYRYYDFADYLRQTKKVVPVSIQM